MVVLNFGNDYPCVTIFRSGMILYSLLLSFFFMIKLELSEPLVVIKFAEYSCAKNLNSAQEYEKIIR
jgi:hypothetical protein